MVAVVVAVAVAALVVGMVMLTLKNQSWSRAWAPRLFAELQQLATIQGHGRGEMFAVYFEHRADLFPNVTNLMPRCG